MFRRRSGPTPSLRRTSCEFVQHGGAGDEFILIANILQVVEAYVRHKLMPADPAGDALHLATTSYHKCDFLVTWNCEHLANANKFGHIRRINTLLGLFVPATVSSLRLFVPAIVTPLELLGADNETASK